MFRRNRLKARIQAGERLFGTWLQSSAATFAELASVAGFDFFIIDQEHGPGGLQEAIDMNRAASGGASTMIVRVPSSDPVYLKRLVDAGMEGILVPMVESAEQARAVVKACRFPPRGTRGNAWDITRSSSYGFVPDYYEKADDNFFVMVQIETAISVENAREIAEVDGVDVVFIGPTDLSGSIGLPGQTGAPEVEALIARTIETVRAVGKPLATVPRVGRTWQQLFGDGFAMVATGSDIFFYRQGASALMTEWRRFGGADATATTVRGGYAT